MSAAPFALALWRVATARGRWLLADGHRRGCSLSSPPAGLASRSLRCPLGRGPRHRDAGLPRRRVPLGPATVDDNRHRGEPEALDDRDDRPDWKQDERAG